MGPASDFSSCDNPRLRKEIDLGARIFKRLLRPRKQAAAISVGGVRLAVKVRSRS